MTKRVRVDVFDGDKKIANFEGNIDMDSFKRTEGRLVEEDKSLEEEIKHEFCKCLNSGLVGHISQYLLYQRSAQIAKEHFKKKFDEAVEDLGGSGYISNVRKAMFGEGE